MTDSKDEQRQPTADQRREIIVSFVTVNLFNACLVAGGWEADRELFHCLYCSVMAADTNKVTWYSFFYEGIVYPKPIVGRPERWL